MKLPTTTFKDLYEARACKPSYKKLVKALGGISKYGRKSPITLLQILDACGLEDLEWVVDSWDVDLDWTAQAENSMYKRVRKAIDQTFIADDVVWGACKNLNLLSDAEYAQLCKKAKKAIETELVKQTRKIRKYLVKHGE